MKTIYRPQRSSEKQSSKTVQQDSPASQFSRKIQLNSSALPYTKSPSKEQHTSTHIGKALPIKRQGKSPLLLLLNGLYSGSLCTGHLHLNSLCSNKTHFSNICWSNICSKAPKARTNFSHVRARATCVGVLIICWVNPALGADEVNS